ncbi:MAG: glycosyltransferase family 4 protein [Firmicutes bacterium]|nr:glycosyltransferase family 4 protein [Bacillota bacterium]
MRVILTTRFYKNGQTTHVTDLCTELMRQGHQVLLIINHLHDPPYARWLQETMIPHVTTTELGKLKKSIHRLLPQPHIIHNHSVRTLPLANTLGKIFQIPKVTTVHYLDFDANLLCTQDAVISISQEMQAQLKKLGITSHVIENGVRIPKQLSTRNTWKKAALFLAQVTPAKEANFRQMTESLLDWGWTITSAGNWSHRGVTAHGWINDVGAVLRDSDLVIGSGRAVRQAMAWGKPAWVLGTYSDGLVTPENIVQLEETNFSGRFSKQPFSRSKASVYLENPSPKEMQELGHFGRRHATEQFSIERMVKKLVLIYESCLLKSSGEKET